MTRRTRILWVFGILFFGLVAFVSGRVSSKGIAHSIAGLPHVPATCDTRSHPILVIGQSQASNTGPVRSISDIKSFALDQRVCYHLRDPMPGSGGRGGSLWPRFAGALRQPVTIIDIAISGSAIERWTTQKQLAKIKTALADFKALGFAEPTIIWMQGETNAARHDSANRYEAQLRKVLATAPNAHWIITRESICNGVEAPSTALNVARDRVAAAFPQVTIGPDLDTIPLSYRQEDRCHMTPAAQDLIAHQMAATFARLQPTIPVAEPTGFARLGL